MEETELTFQRAIKVWWSYTWRMLVLSIPLLIVMSILMKMLIPFPKVGESVPPDQMRGFFPKFFIIWIVMMAGSIGVQVYALQWAIKTKWFDFRLKVIPLLNENTVNPT